MEANMLRERVEAVLDKVRIGLKSEGGDIELVDVKDNVVYVKLKGACGTCPMSVLTMKNWVESSIKKEVPEIIAVQAVQ
jgi:Fe-S cluster biogenesis protein NfuA